MLKVIVLAALLLAPIAVMALGCSSTSTVSETSTPAVEKSEVTAPASGAIEIQMVNNKLCPITGEPVGSMEPGAHVDYKGQRVGLCCSGCAEGFNKDPEANLAKAKANASPAS